MSALVSYGSSSEDEDDHTILVSSADQNLQSKEPTTTNGESNEITVSKLEEGNVAQSGPIIGPARPSDNATEHMGYEEEEEDDQGLTSMGEREALRYLTQPTNPVNMFPPSPSASPDAATEAKFKRFIELKRKGLHFNEDLAKKSTFQNPNLLSTLMERAGITGEAQYRSSLPESIFSLASIPPHAFKEELLKSQQTIRDQLDSQKRADSATGRRTIDFTSGGQSGFQSRDSTPGSHAHRKKL